jgi:hypothetical protein
MTIWPTRSRRPNVASVLSTHFASAGVRGARGLNGLGAGAGNGVGAGCGTAATFAGVVVGVGAGPEAQDAAPTAAARTPSSELA